MRFFAISIFIFSFLFFSNSVFAEQEAGEDSIKTGTVIELSKNDFLTKIYNYEKDPTKWVYEGSKPSIVVFYADWCPPCRKLFPVLKKLAAINEDVFIYRINITREEELAITFGVQSVPAMLFIPMGENPQGAMGALPQEELQKVIDTFLLKKEVEVKEQ